jgi:O-antigen ligase
MTNRLQQRLITKGRTPWNSEHFPEASLASWLQPVQALRLKLPVIHLDPWWQGGLHLRDAALIVLSIVVLGFMAGYSLASGRLGSSLVALVGILVVGIPAVLYLISGVSFRKAFVLMVLTLPLMSGFVIDIGGNLRVTYLFTVLAFAVALLQKDLRRLPTVPVIVLLSAFVLYAVASIGLTFGVDTSGPREAGSGFRVSSYRSIIQVGQLLLMVMAFYLTLNYIISLERLRRFFNLVFWSTAAVTLYGVYDFFTALYGLPFFKVVYDKGYYAGGAGSPSIVFGGVYLPRPRSTFVEPIDLSIFLLFGISYSVAALSSERSIRLRWLKMSFIVLGCLLFAAANARSSLLAMPIVLPLVLWLTRGYVARLRLLLIGAAFYLAVALLLFPLAGGKGNILGPLDFYRARVMSITSIGANLKGAPAGGPIGRNYAVPLRIFREHPIFGVGMGNYPFYYTQADPDYSQGQSLVQVASTFSLYLRLLTELGVVGTSIFLLFVGAILWRLFRVLKSSVELKLRPFATATIVTIVGVMIAKVGVDGLYTDSWLWVTLAVGVAIPHLVRHYQGRDSLVEPVIR